MSGKNPLVLPNIGKTARRARRGALVLLLLAAGCASPRLRPGDVALRVPFVSQPPGLCGPAALAMVERHFGRPGDFEALSAFLDLPALGGTIPELVAEAARRDGLDAAVAVLPPGEIPGLLASGLPPILLLAPASPEDDPRGHFLVATGWRPATGALRAHTGRSENRWLAAEEWRERYLAAGSRAVLVAPPARREAP